MTQGTASPRSVHAVDEVLPLGSEHILSMYAGIVAALLVQASVLGSDQQRRVRTVNVSLFMCGSVVGDIH